MLASEQLTVDGFEVAKADETLEEARVRGRKRVSIEQNKLLAWMRKITTTPETDLKKFVGRYGEVAFGVGRDIGAAEARAEADAIYRQNSRLRVMLFVALAGAALAVAIHMRWLN